MRIPDKNYDTLRYKAMQPLINVYSDNPIIHEDEKWDCDDIARDFWNYAKQTVKEIYKKNGIVGMIDFPEHTQIVFAEQRSLNEKDIAIYYIDQRDWSIYKPNRKPKWIIM